MMSLAAASLDGTDKAAEYATEAEAVSLAIQTEFWRPDLAEKACDAKDYPAVARSALIEMHRQVGDLVIDTSGIARRGLLVRHLVLPGGLAGTGEIMRFIAERISKETYVNIMPQSGGDRRA